MNLMLNFVGIILAILSIWLGYETAKIIKANNGTIFDAYLFIPVFLLMVLAEFCLYK